MTVFFFTVYSCVAQQNSSDGYIIQNKEVDKKFEELTKYFDKGKIDQAIAISDNLLQNDFKACDYFYQGQILSSRAAIVRTQNPKQSYEYGCKYLNHLKLHYDKYLKLYPKDELDKLVNGIVQELNDVVNENPNLGLSKVNASNDNAQKTIVSNDSKVKIESDKVVEEKTVAQVVTANVSNSNDIKAQEQKNETDQDDKSITIVVSGQGKSQDAAKSSALRNAIEQAFGAFISSRTEILNDELISDQITSLSSGNIKSYEILDEVQIPNGGYAMTVKAVVSVNKLKSFVEAKGVKVEINGGLFAINVKQQMLNEQAEVKIVYDLIGLIHEQMQTAYDFKITVQDPKSLDPDNRKWAIPVVVSANANSNMSFCSDYMSKTLSLLSLSNSEVEQYTSLGKKTYPITINFQGLQKQFVFRNNTSLSIIQSFSSNLEFYLRLFEVNNGLSSSLGKGKSQINPILNKNLTFLNIGEEASSFKWQDEFTLAELEKISEYNVKPRGIVVQFKQGGYVLFEDNGHGLVFSLFDMVKWNKGSENVMPHFSNQYTWDEANLECDNLVLSGYSDWRLPTKEEMNTIHGLFNNYKVGDFDAKGYWTSTEGAENDAYVDLFIWNGEPISYFGKFSGFAFRAVRSF